ncbi:MazG-like family protein [Kitasatospora sp. NBC_01266]|uniref:MazG-like family protein n=1 Tax=Kitasatospora sp. NBC_01266 TaxID=2903572 RepID=UPI002E352F5B|nr:MazG-like family protein [Kitasatospora sp. NBC_01266]
MSTADWQTIRQLVAWLDQANGTGPHERAMRVMKLTEEAGEVVQAYIGLQGQNPRKGVTHTEQQVADELCDVIVTAMVALHGFTPDPEQHLAGKIRSIHERSLAHARELPGAVTDQP